jgi:hypothetical protein
VKLHNKSWLDFNMVNSAQSGDDGLGADNWNLIDTDWQTSPKKPTIDGGAHFEQLDGWDDFGVRRRAYWSVFAGAMGYTYGAASIWESHRPDVDVSDVGSDDSWIDALNYPGAFDMKHLRRLMESRPMLDREPADDIIVGNPGNGADHTQATIDGEGRYAMIYVPDLDADLTVNMNKIAGDKAKAWWFNPRTGGATVIGTFSTSGTRTFTTPATGADWVLVLDDKSEDFPKPGKGGPIP